MCQLTVAVEELKYLDPLRKQIRCEGLGTLGTDHVGHRIQES